MKLFVLTIVMATTMVMAFPGKMILFLVSVMISHLFVSVKDVQHNLWFIDNLVQNLTQTIDNSDWMISPNVAASLNNQVSDARAFINVAFNDEKWWRTYVHYNATLFDLEKNVAIRESRYPWLLKTAPSWWKWGIENLHRFYIDFSINQSSRAGILIFKFW